MTEELKSNNRPINRQTSLLKHEEKDGQNREMEFLKDNFVDHPPFEEEPFLSSGLFTFLPVQVQ